MASAMRSMPSWGATGPNTSGVYGGSTVNRRRPWSSGPVPTESTMALSLEEIEVSASTVEELEGSHGARAAAGTRRIRWSRPGILLAAAGVLGILAGVLIWALAGEPSAEANRLEEIEVIRATGGAADEPTPEAEPASQADAPSDAVSAGAEESSGAPAVENERPAEPKAAAKPSPQRKPDRSGAARTRRRAVRRSARARRSSSGAQAREPSEASKSSEPSKPSEPKSGAGDDTSVLANPYR